MQETEPSVKKTEGDLVEDLKADLRMMSSF